MYVLNPKQDLHGLGYDPFKHAPEFRGNGCYSSIFFTVLVLFHIWWNTSQLFLILFSDRKMLRDSKRKDNGTRTDVSSRSKFSASDCKIPYVLKFLFSFFFFLELSAMLLYLIFSFLFIFLSGKYLSLIHANMKSSYL